MHVSSHYIFNSGSLWSYYKICSKFSLCCRNKRIDITRKCLKKMMKVTFIELLCFHVTDVSLAQNQDNPVMVLHTYCIIPQLSFSFSLSQIFSHSPILAAQIAFASVSTLLFLPSPIQYSCHYHHIAHMMYHHAWTLSLSPLLSSSLLFSPLCSFQCSCTFEETTSADVFQVSFFTHQK